MRYTASHGKTITRNVLVRDYLLVCPSHASNGRRSHFVGIPRKVPTGRNLFRWPLVRVIDTRATRTAMLTQTASRPRPSYTMDQTAPAPMRIMRQHLTEAIERAFTESRFAEPPCPMHVCVHGSGKVYVAQMALHVTNEGFSMFSLECNGAPERPLYGATVPETWSRAEFAEWVRSRPDLYATPIIEQLLHKADRKIIRILLVD